MSEFQSIELVQEGELLGIGKLSKRYRRTRQTVHQWAKRHGPHSDSATPMPRPEAIIRQDNGYTNYGWAVEQIPELDAWVERHTNSGGRKVEADEEE